MAKNTVTRKGNATISAFFLILSTCFLFGEKWNYCSVEGFISTKKRAVSVFPSSVTKARIRTKASELCAVTKRQKAIYDGAEFISIASYLISEEGSLSRSDEGEENDDMPPMRAGYMTIVTGTTEADGERVIGVERSPSSSSGEDEQTDDDEFVSLGGGTFVYRDSMATLPEKVSDDDAISTAAAALCGVHCAMSREEENTEGGESKEEPPKIVVLGGGDYACFIAKALSVLGAEVYLVTTRPMALKDTPLNPLRNSKVTAMNPVSGEEELGFCEFIGKFDSVVDTLGDEARLGQVTDLSDGIVRSQSEGAAAKLNRDHDCKRYISTVTKSQRFVLDEGLFFARDPVIKYQEKIEKATDSSQFSQIDPPQDYGPSTLQKLFDNDIIFSAESNENGPNSKKDAFVKGWSFPDYTELEIWPRDSSGSSPVRFGFPGLDELTVEAEVERIMGRTVPAKTKPRPAKKQTNPYVMTIEGLPDITEEIISKERDCVLFVSASYCRMCKTITPAFNRMARISSEEFKDGILFAKANTARRPGKQLAFSLEVESVPTFILFRNGERYGTPLAIPKLPSEKLDLALEYLRTGKEWDPEEFKEDEESNKQRTKLK